MKNLLSNFISLLINDSELIFDSVPSKNRNIILKLFKYIYNETNNSNFLLKEIIKNTKYESSMFILFRGSLSCKYINKDTIIPILQNIKEKEISCSKLKIDAIKYKTHSTSEKAKTGLLNIRDNNDNFFESNLQTKILSKDLLFDKTNFVLVIVENYKIFELNYINKYFNSFNIVLPDLFFIAYGGGEMITNEKFINYLNSFSSIYYFGDYDNNGFKIWEKLYKNVFSVFVLPKHDIFLDIQNYISLHNTDRESIPLITNRLKELFCKEVVFEMQQEMFLD